MGRWQVDLVSSKFAESGLLELPVVAGLRRRQWLVMGESEIGAMAGRRVAGQTCA